MIYRSGEKGNMRKIEGWVDFQLRYSTYPPFYNCIPLSEKSPAMEGAPYLYCMYRRHRLAAKSDRPRYSMALTVPGEKPASLQP